MHLNRFYTDPTLQHFEFERIDRFIPPPHGYTNWNNKAFLTLDLNFSEIDPSPFESCLWPLKCDQDRAWYLLIQAGNREALRLKIKFDLANNNIGINRLSQRLTKIRDQLSVTDRKNVSIPVRHDEIRAYIDESFDPDIARVLNELTSYNRLAIKHEDEENPWSKLPIHWSALATNALTRLQDADHLIVEQSQKQLCNLLDHRLQHFPAGDGLHKIIKLDTPGIGASQLLRQRLSQEYQDFHLYDIPCPGNIFLIALYLKSLDGEPANTEDINLIYDFLDLKNTSTKRSKATKKNKTSRVSSINKKTQIALEMQTLINPENNALIQNSKFRSLILKPLVEYELLKVEHIISIILSDKRCYHYNDMSTLIRVKIRRSLINLGVPTPQCTATKIRQLLQSGDLYLKASSIIKKSFSSVITADKLPRGEVEKLISTFKFTFQTNPDSAHQYLIKIIKHRLSSFVGSQNHLAAYLDKSGIDTAVVSGINISKWNQVTAICYLVQHDVHGLEIKGYGPIEVWIIGRVAYYKNRGEASCLHNDILKNYIIKSTIPPQRGEYEESSLNSSPQAAGNMTQSDSILDYVDKTKKEDTLENLLWIFISKKSNRYYAEKFFFKNFVIPIAEAGWLTSDHFFSLATQACWVINPKGKAYRKSEFDDLMAKKMRHLPVSQFRKFTPLSLKSFIHSDSEKKRLYRDALSSWQSKTDGHVK